VWSAAGRRGADEVTIIREIIMRIFDRQARTLLLAVVAVLAGSASAQQMGSFTDGRDGKTYKTVKIGNQVWMAENLNYQTEKGSGCYDKKPEYCNKYGKLYYLDAALIACPPGWRLPDIKDWNELLQTVGSKWTHICEPETDNCVSYCDKTSKLKSKSEWGGTDDYGFSALPGGFRKGDGSFSGNIGRYGVWWTSSMDELDGGYDVLNMSNSSDYTYNGNAYESFGISVRCIAD
jgi:uncharacterized protein (TIGR02145 family)